jgi:protocatechuate 3,4-dioxygenase beta subunit
MLRKRDVVKRVSAILAVVVLLAIAWKTGPVRKMFRATASVSISPAESPTDPDRRAPAPTLALAPTLPKIITISGHVVDDTDHSPIGNAEVLFRNQLGEATVQTKTDGSFSLQTAPGDYRVAVRGPGVITSGPGDRIRLENGGPVAAVVGAPDETLMPAVHATADIANLELPATASSTITGRVIDENSHPVAHAIVRAHGRGVLRSALGTDSTESDEHGEFTLEVGTGRYALDARAPGFAGLSSAIEVAARSHATQKVALLLARGCEIRGRVVRADGSPAADGAIERQTQDSIDFQPAGRVEPDGTFVWTTNETADIALRAWPWKSMPSNVQVFACHDGARYKDVVLRLPDHPAAISGVVVDASGDPVPFAYVDVEPLDVGRQGQQERADAAGRFGIFDLWGGRYQLTAAAAGRGIAVTTVAVPRGDELKLQLTGTGRIEGTTTALANGTLQVAFDSCFDALDLQKRPMEIAREPRLVTVTGGRFAIDDAPACDLQLHARWRDQIIPARVVVPPAQTGHLELALGPPHAKTVHGIVRDRGGNPVANARVTAVLDGRTTAASTDAEGGYSLQTWSGAGLAAGDGSHIGRALVGRANVGDERVDLTLDQ